MGIKLKLLEKGYGLDILVYDKDYRVRLELAKQGYSFEILAYDQNPEVRLEVAKQGYEIEEFIYDEDYLVRREVARQGYGLEILKDDKDSNVSIEAKRMLDKKECIIAQDLGKKRETLRVFVPKTSSELNWPEIHMGPHCFYVTKDWRKAYVKKLGSHVVDKYVAIIEDLIKSSETI